MGEHANREQSRRKGVQPPVSKAGAGHDVDDGRRMTKTEKDLRRVQGQYDPKQDRFDPKK
jgi:hypothetical protein